MTTRNTTSPQVSDLFDPTHRPGGVTIADRIDASGDCWEWTGGLNTGGYGQVVIYGRHTLVHRLMWEMLVGPIPPELEMDHLCRNRTCVNPDHLEPVTSSVNSLRGFLPGSLKLTHCHRGHPYSGANTYLYPNGTRACRSCRKLFEAHRGKRVRTQHKEEATR